MFVMLALLSPDSGWATPIESFQTANACIERLDEVASHYIVKWPNAIFWCSEPIGIDSYAPEDRN